jgi:serine/threonine protein kinase/tetratricopeptide (TPR) repeat protein
VTADQTKSALNVGDRLGRFRVLASLGAGGMGEVYRARDEKLERDVAVKVLPKGVLDGGATRDRFHKEALALARLSHPHIAQVYDFASEAGVDYLVMELVQGRSLSSRLEDGRLDEEEVLRYGLELASALEAAHTAGVIHRDLKPGNLMIAASGALKVLDFGLAKVFHADHLGERTLTLTDSRVVSGTFPYMAPEQLLGETVDARTDIWAVGIVLFEMATGRRPFNEKSLTRLSHAILTQPPPSPTEGAPGVSSGLARIVLKCLDKEAGRRYQTAADLALDLRRLAGPGTGDLVIGRVTGRKSVGRWRIIAPVVALLAAAAGLAIWRPWHEGRPALSAPAPITSLAVLPLDNFTGDPAQEYFADGMTEAVIAELSKFGSLKVISRRSVMPFKKSTQSLPEIARQLGVEGVIEGSVSRAGGRVRVTAQLIRAVSDEHLWAETFDRDETDVLSLHSEIARAIAAQVRAVVTPEEIRTLQGTRPVNPVAYDLILQANHLTVNASGPNDVIAAVDLAERAVKIDPDSAQAHATLAQAYSGLISFGVKTGREALPFIRAAADKAVALDDGLPEAQTARLIALETAYEWDEAGRAGRRAVDLAPNDGNARGAYAYWLSIMGRAAEAEPEMRRAIDSDPLNLGIRCGYMGMLYALRRDSEALAVARDILGVNPRWFWAQFNMSGLAFLEGRKDEALVQSLNAWQIIWPDFVPPEGLGWEAYVRWLPGELIRREGQPWHLAGSVAAAYAVAGEKERALDYLEREVRDVGIWTLQLYWPEFDGLRKDPRFLKLIKTMNLPVEVYDRPYRELAEAGSR